MTPTELQEILQGDDKLSIKQVKEIIWELKQDCLEEILKLYEKRKEYESKEFKPWIRGMDRRIKTLDTYYGEKYYNGEANAFYICLDLLEKVGENE